MKHSWALLSLIALLSVVPHVRTTVTEDEDINEDPDLSINDLIVNAANTSSEFEFFYDDSNRLLKLEYDMVYSYEEYAIKEEYDNVTIDDEEIRKKRSAGIIAGRGGGQRWTNNIVYYQFSNVFSGRDIRTIRSAISEYERHTCLTFRQRNSGNRIHFKNGQGCYSRVGMVGGAQELGLAPNCRYKGVVVHEVGHALGIHHEQTRPDRDEHVRIIRRNIPRNIYYNFQKNTWRTILNLGIPYDYTSIMHYGKTAFSTNGQLTIQTIDPKYQDVIGNRHGLSFRDIKTVNLMYNCKRHTSGCTKTDSSCPGEGFVGKDCTCKCPGSGIRDPIKQCRGGSSGTTPRPVTPRPTSRPRPTTRPSSCRDQNQRCSHWARLGECRKNPGYMMNYCKRSCNNCGGGSGNRVTCNDLNRQCPAWASRGFCTYGYVQYMRNNCKRSCRLCSARYYTSDSASSTGTGTGTATASANCRDYSGMCAQWARNQQCRVNPAYMLRYCRLSCGQCTASTNSMSSPGVVNSNHNANCRDANQYCSFWAAGGQCNSNPGYMRMMCRLSCGLCPA